MFRYKSGINLTYAQQGYVYFTSLLYNQMPPISQKIIDDLCKKHGGQYSDALFEFVTSDAKATALEMKYYISRATLYRAVKKYYEDFPQNPFF